MIQASDHQTAASEFSSLPGRWERSIRHARIGSRRVAKIAAAAVFCIGVLNAAGANAQAFDLECSIDGQQPSASFNVDATAKTINTGMGTIPAQVSARTIT